MAYTNVSNEFKEIVKSNSITASAKIIFPNLNLTILPHATDNLKSSLADLTIYDKCCDKGKYIGNAVAKKVELQLINKDNLDLADQEFELYVGVKLSNGEYEYIPYGNFIVTAYTDTKSNNKFKIEAYDYMTKLNGYFNDISYDEKNNPNGLKIEYPIKLKAYKEKILTYMGISYVDQTLPNDNFSIDTAINFDGYTIRNVIAKIAELQGTFARINRENKMEFCLQTQTDEEIPLSSMNNKQEINNRYGPVNVVSLTMKNVKGENVTLRDDKSIAKYGETTIEIQDNPFVYTQSLRESAINELYNALKGFSYYPINFNWKARLYTDPSDIIKVYDMRNKKWVNSIVMNQTIKIPVTRQSTLESPALTKTQVANQYISQSKQANTRTEIIVDKQNQKIESVVNNVTEQNNKISQITQTVDDINSKIQDIADITTYGESDRAEVELTDVNESEPIMIKVHPTSTNISYLYPSDNLYPSDTQYIPNRIIRFIRTYEEDGTTKTENIDYLLPDDLLRYSDAVYDEFYLNYESQTCQVIKRCAYNADGTVRALGTEITTDYEYPTITLGEGNYTITLPGYDFGYLYVRLMAKNIYTTQFYTKAETDSRINQKADEINLGVNQTLTNYSTTNEMNSAIDVKANAITQSVSEKYVTNTTLTTNYSTTEATKNMISLTVGEKTKNNLETVTVEYALGTSTTTAPTSGWSTTAPTWQQGKYMWQRTKTKTADGTESISNPTCIAGAKGQDGTNGTNGVSVSSITEYYAVSSSNTSAPADSSFQTAVQTMTTTNKYLWNYELITYSNNTTSKTSKRVIGVYGDKGNPGTNGTNGTNGKDGIGIKSVTNKYQVSNSNTTAPTTWKDTPQTMTATNKYLWNYEIITYSNGTTSTSTPAVIGTYGEKGDKGNTGATGKGVKAVVAQYYLSSSKTSQTGGSWAETQPAYKKDYYYWTRTKITWTDNTTTYTTPILVEEINSLNESVASLNIRAGDIESTVRKKVGEDEIISKINQSAEAVQINANKIDIDGKAVHFKTNISVRYGPFTNQDFTKLTNYFMGTGTLTEEEKQRYDVTGDGTLNSADHLLMRKAINNGGYYTLSGYYEIDPYSHDKSIRIYNNNSNKFQIILSLIYNYINYLYTEGINVKGQLVVEGDISASHQITCENLIQTSKEEDKKNFEKLQNALEIIKSIDIYKYNMKSQEDKEKKHIGFVIGDNYNYSKEVTSIDNEGVDNYSFTSLCCKAIQEQQEEIEELKKEIEKLKGGK